MFIKIKFIVLLFFSVNFLHAFDVSIVNGIWVKKNTYDWIINNPEYRHLIDLTILEGRFQIIWNDKKQEGAFINGMDTQKIKNVEIKDNEIIMNYSYFEDSRFDNQIVIQVISHEVIKIVSHPYDGANYDLMYRIYDPKKPTLVKGIINNNRVRFRNKPEASSGVFYYLDKGEIVFILGLSENKEKIGEMEEYWYEICIGSGDRNDIALGGFYLMGWVYGAYITIDNKEEFEKKHSRGN